MPKGWTMEQVKQRWIPATLSLCTGTKRDKLRELFRQYGCRTCGKLPCKRSSVKDCKINKKCKTDGKCQLEVKKVNNNMIGDHVPCRFLDEFFPDITYHYVPHCSDCSIRYQSGAARRTKRWANLFVKEQDEMAKLKEKARLLKGKISTARVDPRDTDTQTENKQELVAESKKIFKELKTQQKKLEAVKKTGKKLLEE